VSETKVLMVPTRSPDMDIYTKRVYFGPRRPLFKACALHGSVRSVHTCISFRSSLRDPILHFAARS
jgi:hypothetical protein